VRRFDVPLAAGSSLTVALAVSRRTDVFAEEAGGSHADDGDRRAADADDAVEDVGIASESAPPVSVAGNRDRMRAGRDVVGGAEDATGRGADAQGGKIRARHQRDLRLLARPLLDLDVERLDTARGKQAREDFSVGLKGLEDRIQPARPDDDELLRIPDRQAPKDDGLQQAENCRRRADAEPERQRCHEGEPR
jgi:hypothetical protein